MNDIRKWQSSLDGVVVSPFAFESGWMGEVDEQRELLTAWTCCCQQASQPWFRFRCIFWKCFSMLKWIGEKIVERNLATLMKTKLRAPSPEISSWGIRLRRFGKCPLLENFRSLSAWRARLRSWRSWSCSLLLSNDKFMFLWKVRCIYVHTTRICPCRDPLVWFVVLFQAKWSSLDEDDFVSFLQILDALLEALSFVVMHPIQASDTTQGLDPITLRC